MNEIKKYVAGLLFSEDKTRVVLVRKNRPTWQMGKLNAVGGKIENNESPIEAMIREFAEEAGVILLGWKPFSILRGKDFEVKFFKAFGNVDLAKTLTDESIEILLVSEVLNRHDKIPNLNWIIPLALDKDDVFSIVDE